MKKVLTIILIGIISMGLFSFLKKEKKVSAKENTPILGFVLLEDSNSFDLIGMVKELKNKWNLDVNDEDADDKAAVLKIGDYNIAIANIPAPIPENEVEKTAEYNYFWKNGVKESAKHKGHIVLSITNAGKNVVQENLLYCKVASAVMNNSKSLGIYIGGRTLVLKKEFYLENV